MDFRQVSLGLFAGGVVLAGPTLPANAQAPEVRQDREDVTIQVPVMSTKAYGPTRLIGVELADTLRPGVTLIEGRLWANNLGALTGQPGMSAGLLADFGINDRLAVGLAAGFGMPNMASINANGKYLFMSEAYGGAPVSVAGYARMSLTNTSLTSNLFSLGSTAVGLTLAVPITKSLTDRITVTAAPGLTFMASTAGVAPVGNLGIGVDVGITDRFRALVDTTLGTSISGLVAVPGGTLNAALRYAFTSNLVSDLYFGFGTAPGIAGIQVPVNLPTVGLGTSYRF